MRNTLLAVTLLLAACTSSGGDDVAVAADAGTFTVTEPTQLVDGLDYPTGAAVDGKYVFWSEQRPPSFIERLDLETMKKTDLVTGSGQTLGPVVLDGYVYWVDRQVGGIWRVSEEGGDPETVVAAEQAQTANVTTDGTRIYWVTPDKAYSGAADGSDVKMLGAYAGNGYAPKSIYVEGDRLLWFAVGEVWAVATDGGSPSALASVGDPSFPASDVAAGDGHIFVTNHVGTPMEQFDDDGTHPIPLVSDRYTYSVVFVDGTIYYTATSLSGDANEVSAVAPGGTQPARVIATVPQNALGLTVQGDTLFFVTASYPGGLWAAPR